LTLTFVLDRTSGFINDLGLIVGTETGRDEVSAGPVVTVFIAGFAADFATNFATDLATDFAGALALATGLRMIRFLTIFFEAGFLFFLTTGFTILFCFTLFGFLFTFFVFLIFAFVFLVAIF
jgi:hypothetical protein